MTKKLYSREEFSALLDKNAELMATNIELRQRALDLKVQAGHDYYWVHQTSWLGEPCLQLAQDMFAIQEAIVAAKPDYVVEIGVAWGGSTLFISSILEVLGLKGVIGVDIFIPDDLRARIERKKPNNVSIDLIEGSSVDDSTFRKVTDIVNGKSALVILDSMHTHDHVLRELQLYSTIVPVGSFLVVGDTIIEEQPPANDRPRPWGLGNNPATALREFLTETDAFEVDKKIENKLLLSNMPNGYLRRVRP